MGGLIPDLAAARTRFRDASLGYWVSVQSGDADGANEETERGDAIVRLWAGEGREIELLKPLLADADPEVRFAAASHLLNSGVPEAVTVLEELAADPSGMIAPTARLRLATVQTEIRPATIDDVSRRRPPSETELLALLPKLNYEVGMLHQSLLWLGAKSKAQPSGHIVFLTNAVVESGLIHVRSLLEFFYLENQDVGASDYLAPGEWSRLRPDSASTLGEEHGRLYGDLSRKLAHVTVRRGGKREWDSRLWNGMLEVARVWIDALPPRFAGELSA